MKKIIIGLFLIAIVLLSILAIVSAQVGVQENIVTLTANTDQTKYPVYSLVTFNESMAFFSNPSTTYPGDGLVGVQIQDPTGTTMVIRTLRTGSINPTSWPATVTQDYLCNGAGAQISSISIPSLTNPVIPTFYFSVTNNLQTQQTVYVIFNVFDSNGVPISVASQQVTLGSLASYPSQVDFPISSAAHFGTAYAYVGIYSNWPSQGGYPLTPDQTFQFTITGGTAIQGTPATAYVVNNGLSQYFNLTFRMPKGGALGTYTAYSSADYHNTQGLQTTSFSYSLLGDINNDGLLNFNDITSFVTLYIAYYSQHIYTAAIDFNNDKVINFNDITLFVQYYILYWSS